MTAVLQPKLEDALHCRTLAAKQREQATNEVLPSVRSLLEASALRWDTLGEFHAQKIRSARGQTRPGLPATSVRGETDVTLVREGAFVPIPVLSTTEAGRSAIRLTGQEQALLDLLASHNGNVVSRQSLMVGLYHGVPHDPKNIGVLICKLRRKLARAYKGQKCIRTVRGCGYSFAEPL